LLIHISLSKSAIQHTSSGGTTNNKPSWASNGHPDRHRAFRDRRLGRILGQLRHAGYAAMTASSGDDAWVVNGVASWMPVLRPPGHVRQLSAERLGHPWNLGTGRRRREREDMGRVLDGYALGPGIALEGQVAYTNANYCNISPFGVSMPGPSVGTSSPGVNASNLHSWDQLLICRPPISPESGAQAGDGREEHPAVQHLDAVTQTCRLFCFCRGEE
jgi:hypothetical protein